MKHNELLKLPIKFDTKQIVQNNSYFVASVHRKTVEGQVLQLCEYNTRGDLRKRHFFKKDKSWFTYDVKTNTRNTIKRLLWTPYYESHASSSDLTNNIIDNFFKEKKESWRKGTRFIDNFQYKLLREKEQERKEKREAESIEYLIRTEKLTLPEGLENWLRQSIIPTDNFIFYKGLRCRCTSCGARYKANSKPVNYTTAYCQICGAKKVYSTEHSSETFNKFVANFSFIQSIGNDFVIRCFHLKRDYAAMYSNIERYLDEFARYYFAPGKTFMFCNEYKWGMSAYLEKMSDYVLRGAVTVFDGGYFFKNASVSELVGTFIEKQIPIIKDYLDARYDNRINPIIFLYKLNLYPSVEYLWKMGLKNIVHEVVNGRKKENSILNLRGKTASSVLKISPGILKQYPKESLKEQDIVLIKLAEASKTTKPIELFNIIRNTTTYDINKLKTLTNNLTVDAIVRYLSKQAASGIWITKLSDYYDYIQECQELKYDLNDDLIAFPKNLDEAHLRTASLIEFEKHKDKVEAYAAAVKKWIKKEYKNERYLIKCVQSSAELITEAKRMRNCAGGYINRIIAKNCVIFVIKKLSCLNEPFYMLELNCKNLSVVQCRGPSVKGYSQPSATPEVQAFVDEWLKKKVKKAA